MRKICLLSALLCMVGTCAIAVADDLYPGSFRGYPLSVEAHWDFAQAPMEYYYIPPDKFNAIGGSNEERLYDDFSTHLETNVTDWGWLEDPADRFDGGITPTLGHCGRIKLASQNWIDGMPYKYLRLQITSWWSNGLSEQPIFPMALSAGDRYDSCTCLGSGYVPAGQGKDPTKDYSWFDIMIVPNPDWETITLCIPEGLVVDQIDIDTVSLPEPITISLIGFGAMLAMRKRS